MAHRASGNPKKALRVLDEGIELGRSYEIPYELARSLVWAGETRLSEPVDEEQAYGRRQLWEARGIFARLGLTTWIHTIDRTLGFAEEGPSAEEPGVAALETIDTLDRNALRFGIVTCDRHMREAIATVQSVAPSTIPVLISGESGVGKELLAQALHQMSERRRHPFVAVNCGAIPVGLMESELFGHERGAFTGALQNREGLIVSADGGSLFLDEIGELPGPVQASLLRVLESGELRAVGQDVVRKVNIRIVAATNARIEDLVVRGVFRQDLYYRLNGVRVTLPPLRDREEDIRVLFRYFWSQAVASARKTLRLSGEVEATLCAYSWPGNVRELKHEIARVVALAADGSFVTPDAFLPHQMRKEVAVLRRTRVRRDETRHEREEILEALRAHRGNKAEAARSLGGMKRTTLLYKIERLGIRPEEYETHE
jgi:transcriptional regulator with PAS, ATPase and Fis domain